MSVSLTWINAPTMRARRSMISGTRSASAGTSVASGSGDGLASRAASRQPSARNACNAQGTGTELGVAVAVGYCFALSIWGFPSPTRRKCWGGWPHGINHVPELGCKRPKLEPPMTQYKRIGIDTSKAVFTLHGIDDQERPVLRINLRRTQMRSFFSKLPPTVIALEACGGSHYWARELTALGHTVRLIPPQYVKPYVKRGKNDRNDAEAICEAAGRPGMHFVPVKSVTQQAQGMILKVRETLIGQRVALINTVRGHAAEFGIITGKGAGKIVPLLSAIEQDAAIPPEARGMFVLLGQQIDDIDARIKEVDAKLNAAHKANELSRRLVTIPGVGPIIALTLAVEIDPAMFESGRHLAAWAGLTPKERSTAANSEWAASAGPAMSDCASCSSLAPPR